MKIYSALQIGEYHTNHCEDYVFVGDIGPDKVLCAVMDGCTMATDSYFVSTLVGKILRKIAKEKGYQELYQSSTEINVDGYLKSVVASLFMELNIVKNQLMLERNELLTTLIIMLFDRSNQKGIVLVIGDGLVSINGYITEFDQDNKPDYLGFHLHENFDSWYESQCQKIEFDTLQDVSIATDGIFMFAPIKKVDNTDIIDPISFLLSDKTNVENADMLSLKLKTLEHVYGLKPTDDFAMVRLIA
ncbi:protein phosphatase 2C domain-containing protein [Hymenobacter cellulosilyticus]|uniref:Protein phosphatase 2C domain-containing protein n=1 Tax=Hymenobacter cellulosilyticus TaxID=2932248 RepID=A0A8T9Q5K0_9BACT|nr:protein phosphatase 2C domain-containing protein [Hymenobacter cellulosilyticus]UOQ71050.1 protein phosphatase 2C domain-containing protein [Hymenobacter cellulosilyticus]